MLSPDSHSASHALEKSKISESEIILRRVLKSSPQSLWLDTIRRTRGPEHDTLVYWMLNQTECDFAVAVHAFYRSKPADHLDDPRPLPTRPGPSEIFALVLHNWDTGSYRTHRLKVENVDVNARTLTRVNQKAMARQRGTMPFTIPSRLLQPIGGSVVPVPPYMLPSEASHLWPLYHDMGMRVPDTPPGIRRKLAKFIDFIKGFGLRRPAT